MLEAAWWGFVGGSALLVGAIAGVLLPVGPRLVGVVMAFGSGALISALSFDLTVESFDLGGGTAVVVGLLAGSLAFFAGDAVIDRRGGHRRKSPTGPQPGAGATALVLGATLDGIPESAAIGVTLLEGGAVGAAFVAAVFLSNLPEAWSASAGMKSAGHRTAAILRLWLLVTAASTLAAALGYGLLGGATPFAIAVTQAFAAGAILTMLADTMVPEAVEHAGPLVGLVAALGFTAAFLIWAG
ncbi:MAG TPA: ZIP family zinc transporter [Nocardioidaceae bacterium]